MTATLSDANVSEWTEGSVTWQWQRKRPVAETWTHIVEEAATNTHSYTLGKEDENPTDWPMEGLTGGDKDDGDPNTEDYPEYRVSDFETMLFGDNYTRSPDDETAYGSMRQYYEDMSRQSETDTPYTIRGRVVNKVREDDSDIPIWVTLGKTKSYYHNGTKQSFRDAALAAATSQQGIDTTTSATRKLCIIYAGNKYSGSGGLHPHYRANLYVMSERTANSFGVEKNDAEFSPIGTHCHEFGHVLGLADHYQDPRNYRLWGLMASGNYKGGGSRIKPEYIQYNGCLGCPMPSYPRLSQIV